MKAEVKNVYGDYVLMSLPAPLWEGKAQIGTGVWLTGLYRGPRTGRTVARYMSSWVDSKTGLIEGESFAMCDNSTWLWYCETAGINDPQVEAEEL
jgi:hypothetical protein